MSTQENQYKRFIVLSPTQLARLQGRDKEGDKLDRARVETLQQVTRPGPPPTRSELLQYQDALRKYALHSAEQEQAPLKLPLILPPPLGGIETSASGSTEVDPSGSTRGVQTEEPKQTTRSRSRRSTSVPSKPRRSSRGRNKGVQTDMTGSEAPWDYLLQRYSPYPTMSGHGKPRRSAWLNY